MFLIHTNIPYAMLLDRIDFVVENRIHPEIYFSGQDLDDYHEKDVKTLAGTLRHNGLEVSFHGPFMDLSPGGADQRVKKITSDRFLETMELARFFRPKTIVFHPAYDKRTFDGNVKVWLESSLETWGPLVKKAEKMGLNLVVENIFEENPDSIKNLLEKINSAHFRFCFDTGHHHLFSRVSVGVWVKTLGRFMIEVHLHDNHGEMDEHLPPGEGGFKFGQFFSLLSRFDLNPICTIEPHEEAHLSRSLERVKKYAGKNKFPESTPLPGGKRVRGEKRRRR